MKNNYVKDFFRRGMMFGGFGPIIAGVIYLIVSHTVESFSLTGGEVCLAIISTYLLAFVQAGASVFNQIEHWSLMKSLLCHLSVIYVAYSLCYIVNTWIPFEPMVLLIFTAIFLAAYLIIWFTVYVCVNITRRRLNAKL